MAGAGSIITMCPRMWSGRISLPVWRPSPGSAAERRWAGIPGASARAPARWWPRARLANHGVQQFQIDSVGLMLQTRIHMLNDDLFQAEQTLKSVIDFYPDSNDGIQSEANDLWDELMQLKNPPATEEKEPEMKIEINEN